MMTIGKLRPALALLLCIATLATLTGCNLHITINIAPETTPTALPTAAPQPTPTETEKSPVPSVASSPSVTPTPSATPTAVTPTASVQPTPTPVPDPSLSGVMDAVRGRWLSIPDELAQMRAQLGVEGENVIASADIPIRTAEEGYWGNFELMDGTFCARYDENLQRTSCFYLEKNHCQGFRAQQVLAQEENWLMVLQDVPAADVPAGTTPISGYAAERFGKTVDVLCTVSNNGEILEYQYIFPRGCVYRVIADFVLLGDEKEDVTLVVDLRTNTQIDLSKDIVKNIRYIDDDIVICREYMTSDSYGNVTEHMVGYTPSGKELWKLGVPFRANHVERMADGTYYMTATSREEKDYYIDAHDENVYFFKHDETPKLAHKKGQVYAAIKENLRQWEKNGYEFSIPSGYSLCFLSPDTIRVTADIYVSYEDEYFDVPDNICVWDFEI